MEEEERRTGRRRTLGTEEGEERRERRGGLTLERLVETEAERGVRHFPGSIMHSVRTGHRRAIAEEEGDRTETLLQTSPCIVQPRPPWCEEESEHVPRGGERFDTCQVGSLQQTVVWSHRRGG
eukprot:829133-Rhodomonas_salina.4